MPMNPFYHPPLRAIGSVRFRSDGPTYPAYEASTPTGPQLVYWSSEALAHIPVHNPSRLVAMPGAVAEAARA